MYDYGPPDTWEWGPISKVLQWCSVDAGAEIRCPSCEGPVDETSTVGTSFDLYCYNCEYEFKYSMDQVLDVKRMDHDYGDVVDSVRTRGWVYPLHTWGHALTDGHHRLAAAIDLGMDVVPMYYGDDCRQDFEDWRDEIDNQEVRTFENA